MYIARFLPCGRADILFVVMKVKGKLMKKVQLTVLNSVQPFFSYFVYLQSYTGDVSFFNWVIFSIHVLCWISLIMHAH